MYYIATPKGFFVEVTNFKALPFDVSTTPDARLAASFESFLEADSVAHNLKLDYYAILGAC